MKDAAPTKRGKARKVDITLAGRTGGVELTVDDHPLTSEGLAGVINRESDLEVCGLAGNPAEAMSALVKFNPDLMVTDMTMLGRSGIEFLKDVHAMRPELPMLVLSMHDETLYAERVLRAGARAYVMKERFPPAAAFSIALGHQRINQERSQTFPQRRGVGIRVRRRLAPDILDGAFPFHRSRVRWGKVCRARAVFICRSPRSSRMSRDCAKLASCFRRRRASSLRLAPSLWAGRWALVVI